MFFTKPWKAGFKSTIFLLATITVFSFTVNLTQPLERILVLFIPEKYIFWGLPFLIIIGLITPVMGFLTNGKTGRFVSSLVNRIPFLNIIFQRNDKMELVKKGIPVAIPIKISNVEIYIYGFVMGASKVVMEDKEKTVVSIYLPSIPIPFTSWIALDVDLESVREVQVLDKNISATTSIIQNKCISFGQPLGKKIRFKKIKEREVQELKIKKEMKNAEN